MGAETTAERIRRRRERLGITQAEIGSKLGLTPEGYGHYERGRSEFTESQLREISQILDIPLSWLLGEQTEEEFEDAEAARWYRGMAPNLRPAAREMLRVLYEQTDREGQGA